MVELDTLRYKYLLKSNKSDFFEQLMAEQFKFFKQNDPQILSLDEGISINCQLNTKIQGVAVTSVMTIKEIIKDKKFEMETVSPTAKITQTYEFQKNEKKQDVLIYSEKNTFSEMRNQYGFIVVGGIYKLFYNRGISKRMRYIDQLASGAL